MHSQDALALCSCLAALTPRQPLPARILQPVQEMGAVETLIVWENLDINRYVFTNPSTGERSHHWLASWATDVAALAPRIACRRARTHDGAAPPDSLSPPARMPSSRPAALLGALSPRPVLLPGR